MEIWLISFFVPGQGYGTLKEAFMTEAAAQAVVDEQKADPDMEGISMKVFSAELQVTIQ